jgi:hypothetical protein
MIPVETITGMERGMKENDGEGKFTYGIFEML